MRRDALALDRAPSVRSYDADGRLHVSRINLSQANVCDYLGAEIPGCEALGLDPRRRYALLRPADELAAAVSTFNGLPLLREHVAVDAVSYRPDLVVGAVGNDARFITPYLVNSIVVWAADAIAAIEVGTKRSVSLGYRYIPVMQPGSYKGERYDGRMTQLGGNHLALVNEGRIGRSAVIGDTALPRLSKEAARAAVLRLVPELANIKIGTP
jgi:uncharacterized protein